MCRVADRDTGDGKQIPLDIGAKPLGFVAKRIADINAIQGSQGLVQSSVGVQRASADQGRLRRSDEREWVVHGWLRGARRCRHLQFR